MQTARLRPEEITGLMLALFLHLALIAVLVARLLFPVTATPTPQPITVSLAEEVGLEAASPNPVPESRLAQAPELDDIVTPPQAEPLSPPVARDEVRQSRPSPKPSAKPEPKKSAPQKSRTERPRNETRQKQGQRSGDRASGQMVSENFLDGLGSSPSANNTGAPASKLGASELASLDSAIGRQVKVKWQGRVPQGPDADKLVTRVRFQLNPDGTLAGEPRVVGETQGVTELNRKQVGRHQEEAIRAIKLVGRFRLPFEVPPSQNTFTIRFDRNLQ